METIPCLRHFAVMTEVEKKSWEEVRRRGRDRFLLQGIARARWVLVGGALVELCWWLFAGKVSAPLWGVVVGWVFVAVGSGAFGAFLEWNTNERKYVEGRDDEARH